MALHRQEKRVPSKLWTTFLSMLVRSGHSHLLKSLKKDKYLGTEGVENRVGDDGVRAILQYRPSDLYLTDRKETMAILQKYTHTSLHIRK